MLSAVVAKSLADADGTSTRNAAHAATARRRTNYLLRGTRETVAIGNCLLLGRGRREERVARDDAAGGLGLLAQEGVELLVGERAHDDLLAGAARGAREVAVDDARALAPLGDRGHDERLADARVTAREHARLRGLVDGRLDVAAGVEVDRELLDGALVLGVVEADRDEHEVGVLDVLRALDRPQVARGRAGDPAGADARDPAVGAEHLDDLRRPLALAALVERVRRGRALGRQRPRRALVAPAGGKLGVDVEHVGRRGALADGVGDAVHAGVATADD